MASVCTVLFAAGLSFRVKSSSSNVETLVAKVFVPASFGCVCLNRIKRPLRRELGKSNFGNAAYFQRELQCTRLRVFCWNLVLL
jgi:hypothetical protein